jgi:hypothetical protein
MRVSKEVARARVRNLEQYVKEIPTELVLNVDEAGSQKWANRKKCDVIIPH